MWKRKRVIFVVLLAIAVLVGATTGVALAQTGNGDESQPKTLLSRVAEILDIDQQELKDAFAQAQREMQDEALDRYLQKAVEQGKLTEEQADQYKEWWQAKPDTPLPGPAGRNFGPHGFRGGMRWGGGHQFWGWPHQAPNQAAPTPEASGSEV